MKSYIALGAFIIFLLLYILIDFKSLQNETKIKKTKFKRVYEVEQDSVYIDNDDDRDPITFIYEEN